MELDNKQKASTIKLINMLIPLIVVIGMAVLYLVTEIREVSYALYGVSFLIVYFVILGQIKPMFISVFIGPELLRFRFKSLSPFNSSNKTIQLKPTQFNRYDRIEKLSGFKKQLVVYVNSPSGLAKYPPISISALTKDEIEKLCKALQLIMAMNKSAQKDAGDKS